MFIPFKTQLVRRYPHVASVYQTLRHRLANQHDAVQTPYGFTFRGHPAMQDGSFERHETALINEHLNHATVFVDVGANVGYFSCLARQRDRHVVAVEPLQENLEQLYENFQANGWCDIEVYPLGLSSRAGLTTLYGGGSGASLLCGWSGTSSYWHRTIPLSTLDTLVGHRFPGEQMLIKIDVEGAEYGVLQGAAQTLARAPSPVWLLEHCLTEHHPTGLNPHFQDVFESFWQRGYQAHTVAEERRSVTRKDMQRWISCRQRDFGYVSYVFERI